LWPLPNTIGRYAQRPIGLFVFFAKGDIQHSLGQRPRNACGARRFPGAMPLAMMNLAVGQFDWSLFVPHASLALLCHTRAIVSNGGLPKE
ncbi:MAG: hypothetical protein ACKO3V_05945, partial [Pirellula sp.]